MSQRALLVYVDLTKDTLYPSFRSALLSDSLGAEAGSSGLGSGPSCWGGGEGHFVGSGASV